jgi:hypothetical protein
VSGSQFWLRHIAFRDYLRAHPESAAGYFELKLTLAAACTKEAYTEAKSPFVEGILERALLFHRLDELEGSVVFSCFQGWLMMPTPVEVKALPNYRIWLRYDDGTEGEVDLSDLAGRGVFRAWNDSTFYGSVRVGSHGAIEWGSDIDLCPDAMYMRLRPA